MLKMLRRSREELRCAPRRPTKASAKVGLVGNRNLSCAVQDISATGAKLAIPWTVFLPREFTFELPSMNMKKRARLKWRKGDHVGVAFMKAF